jgi:hypothetical protein
MKKEQLVKVSDVKVGDLIETSTGYTKVSRVVTEHIREGYYIIDGGLKITNDHPFLHDGEWITPEKYDGEKQYVEETTPTVYIETESGEFLTYAGEKHWTVSGNYAPDWF